MPTTAQDQPKAADQQPATDPDEFSARAFRRCLGQYATGVTIITTCNDGKLSGIAANSFSSLSLDPPLILWSIGKSSRSLDAFQNASHFAINVLSSNQVNISQTFSSKTEDKFSTLRWTPGEGGSPVLEDVAATMECAVETQYDAGDHVLVIGRVLRFCQADGAEPLLFSQGRYAIPAVHPDFAEGQISPSVAASPAVETGAETSLWRLLFYAQHALSRSFEKHRSAVGYPTPQGPILTALVREMPKEELQARSFLAPAVFEDNLSELQEGGFVNVGGGLVTLTEAGRRRRDAIKQHLEEFEAEQWNGASEAEIAATKSLLARVVREYMPSEWAAI